MMYAEFVDMCRVVRGLMVPTRKEEQEVYMDPDAALVTRRTDPVVTQPSGILLQRCGGGRRVIRKRVGSN